MSFTGVFLGLPPPADQHGDVLAGGSGDDYLFGHGGDTLDGGNGNDVLKGEAGVDTYDVKGNDRRFASGSCKSAVSRGVVRRLKNRSLFPSNSPALAA